MGKSPKKAKPRTDYQTAVDLVETSNRQRADAGLKTWTVEQKKFAVAWYLTGFRAGKKRETKGQDDDDF